MRVTIRSGENECLGKGQEAERAADLVFLIRDVALRGNSTNCKQSLSFILILINLMY